MVYIYTTRLNIKNSALCSNSFSCVYHNKRLSQWPRPSWDCGFEFRQGHECLSAASVVCCQVEVCAYSWGVLPTVVCREGPLQAITSGKKKKGKIAMSRIMKTFCVLRSAGAQFVRVILKKAFLRSASCAENLCCLPHDVLRTNSSFVQKSVFFK